MSAPSPFQAGDAGFLFLLCLFHIVQLLDSATHKPADSKHQEIQSETEIVSHIQAAFSSAAAPGLAGALHPQRHICAFLRLRFFRSSPAAFPAPTVPYFRRGDPSVTLPQSFPRGPRGPSAGGRHFLAG